MKRVLFFILIININLSAQQITWQEITSNYSMPSAIKVFKGERSSPKLQIWYIELDLNSDTLTLRPYISSSSMNVPDFVSNVGAIAAINGGFFGGSNSYSTVLYPNEVKAQNVSALTRNQKSYPIIRSMFSLDNTKQPSINWIYHFGNKVEDIFTFGSPLSYTNDDPNPLPPPTKDDGNQLNNLLVGIGGGPTLVKNGIQNVTYNEEIFWGSGVGLTNNDPRTAVGYTNDNKVIMITADGRKSTSEGVSLIELADIMIELGCVEAMNLDGGGSTQMAIGSSYVNSSTEQRAVPTILAIVHTDSLNLSSEPVFEKFIDTGDTEAEEIGTGWFATANEGFYGDTPSMLNQIGDGSNSYKFNLNLPDVEAEYEIYGWWVSAVNRCTDTPFIINHSGKNDTIKIDQSVGGSSWQLVGKFNFNGSSGENVTITNAGKNGSYVVADAIRIISYDNKTITSVDNNSISMLPTEHILYQNYPNPFNPTTKINFTVSKANSVSLKVFDSIGKEIKVLLNDYKTSGNYSLEFDATGLASGLYFYRLTIGDFVSTKEMVLVK